MMSDSSGRPDFFVLEAGEYLQELGRRLGGDAAPDQEATRLARALRGASLLGGPADFTPAAAALEAAIRAAADGHLPWNPGVAELLRHAVETLNGLLRRTRTWHQADSREALHLAARLDEYTRAAGAPPPPPFGRRSTDRNQPGVRAFLAREAAIVAGAVERLARDPAGLESPVAIENVLRTTRPLRGVAFLGEVPPLGELLDLAEQLLRDPLTGVPASPAAPEALGRLAAAMARAARELTVSGSPVTDSPELLAAAHATRRAVTDESDVVSIEGLFADGDTRPVIHRGTPPAQELSGPDAALPLLALAGRLAQAADQFGRAVPPALRALQETALLLQLRAGLPPRPALPTDRVVAAMVRALGRGAASANPPRFIEGTRQATAAFNALATGASEVEAPSLQAVTAYFEALPGGAETALPEQEHADDAPIVPIESLAPGTESDVVPIETLLAEPPRPAFDALERSMATYQGLLGSVPALLLPSHLPTPPAAPAIARRRPAEEDGDIVPIESLLYRGRGALVRAGEVRREIDAIVAAFKAERRLEPLIQELLDLVPLALDESA